MNPSDLTTAPPKPPAQATSLPIKLSNFTSALIQNIKNIKRKSQPSDLSSINVSQTVSFLAIVYEKIRNAIEYREDHLIRRAAIERNLKRRLSLNPQGKGEAENIIRELLWARYFPNGGLGEEDVERIQKIIDKYLILRRQLLVGRNQKEQHYLYDFMTDLLTCEIEESLAPESAQKYANFTFFIYQTLRGKIKIEGLSDEQKDAFFLVAVEKAYRKSDMSYERYHLFITFYKPLSQYDDKELSDLVPKLPQVYIKVDKMINNPYVDGLTRFIKKQLPPFLILFDIYEKSPAKFEQILKSNEELWKQVDLTCREKYQQGKSRLHNLAFRSLIYIFVTKMIFALILEYPVSLYLYNEVNLVSIGINSFFPPILMLVIVLFFKLPGEENTKNINRRIIDIIDIDKSFETQVAFIKKKAPAKRPLLVFLFTIFYSLTFVVTLYLIRLLLNYLHFNLISQIIFIFFVSVVTFFSFRIKQVANEYRLKEKESVLTPVFDFFFIPILSLGKFFSTELGRLNFLIVFFDFIIEAPFKLIIEVIEEWIGFVRQRKEEIV